MCQVPVVPLDVGIITSSCKVCTRLSLSCTRVITISKFLFGSAGKC